MRSVVVCDATCLERGLNLLLQVLEITGRTVLCLNLMDEARKKRIHIDLDAALPKARHPGGLHDRPGQKGVWMPLLSAIR